jgi:uncharacterized integral membrane protein
MCRQFIQVQVRTAEVLVIIRSRRAFVFAFVGIRLAVFHRLRVVGVGSVPGTCALFVIRTAHFPWITHTAFTGWNLLDRPAHLWRRAYVRGMNSRVSQSTGGLPPDQQPYDASQAAGIASSVRPESSVPAGIPSGPTVPTTRTGIAWWALGFSLLLLIVVLIFVLQNLSPASTTFFSIKWTIPLGLDLLLAALLGGVIAFLLGAARMLQLRRVARRYAGSRRRNQFGALESFQRMHVAHLGALLANALMAV